MKTARRTLTPSQRASNVLDAHAALRDLLAAAILAAANHGDDSDEAHAAWEAVEKHGATIHRQSRLLAGKSKGG